jgi:hypothetical protein
MGRQIDLKIPPLQLYSEAELSLQNNGVIQIIRDALWGRGVRNKGFGKVSCNIFYKNFEPYFCIMASMDIMTLFLEKLKFQGTEQCQKMTHWGF